MDRLPLLAIAWRGVHAGKKLLYAKVGSLGDVSMDDESDINHGLSCFPRC